MKIKILIIILASNKIELLKESYKSACNQKNLDEEKYCYDIILNINTLDDEFYKSVLIEFPNVNIIKTESNGKPGKGHNSSINIFRNDKNYDYLITFDGDDFLYPYALHRFTLYLQYKPDFLLLPCNDILSKKIYDNKSLSIDLNNKAFLSFSNYSHNMKENLYNVKLNPFKYPLESINTPGRLLFQSRKTLEYNISFDENLQVYDDLHAFLQIMELNTLNNDLNIFYMQDYDILLYNKLNEMSVTKKIENRTLNYNEENYYFKESIKNKFFLIRNWNLKDILFIENNFNEFFSIHDKIKFSEEIVDNLNLDNNKDVDYIYHNQINYSIENQYEELYKIFNSKINKNKHLIYFSLFGENEDYFLMLQTLFNSLLKSYLDNSLEGYIDLLVLTDDYNIEKINNYSKKNNINIKTFLINDVDSIDKIWVSMYYIFYYKNINNYDKILYSDSDIIFNHNFYKIFEENIDDDFIYAYKECRLMHESGWWGYHLFKNFNIDTEKYGGNAGLIFFKNSYNTRVIFNKIINYYNSNEYNNIRKLGDQPLFNFITIINNSLNLDLFENYCILNPKISLEDNQLIGIQTDQIKKLDIEKINELQFFHFPGDMLYKDTPKIKTMNSFLEFLKINQKNHNYPMLKC